MLATISKGFFDLGIFFLVTGVTGATGVTGVTGVSGVIGVIGVIGVMSGIILSLALEGESW